jgi:ADP-ribosylglycohydrolase
MTRAPRYPATRERLAGALYGLLIGDAVGRPYEFRAAAALPARELLDMEPPAGFTPTYPQVPIGTWTDDGAHALALLDSLLDGEGLVLEDLGQKLLAWYEHGAYTPDGQVFDCGIQTRRALQQIRQGVSAERSGPAGEYDNGNGSLMRTLPLALWHTGDDHDLARLAIRQCLPTHGHPRSGVVGALYCLLARRGLAGEDVGVDDLAQSLRLCLTAEEESELDRILHAPQRQTPQGTGYVVDTFWSALAALEESGYEAVIRAAIALGNDTDTTACVAGGLAGLRAGYGGLPARWLNALHGKALVEPLLDRLVERVHGV